jgi:hypothetical protein
MGGGASAAANENQAAQTNFYNALQQQQQTQFANQQELQGTIKSAFTPIVNAGVNQSGFSPSELATLRTSAADTAGQNYANAARSVAANAAGNDGPAMSSGVVKEQQAGVAAGGAAANTNAQNQITLNNAETGQQNFFKASDILSGANQTAAGSTTGLAEGTNAAGGNATKAIGQVDQENSAGSWQTILGGALGSVASGVTSGLTGDLGTEASKVGSGNWGW